MTTDKRWLALAVVSVLAIIVLLFNIRISPARDLDGRYANSPLKPWFDHLASGKGLCCSMADGYSVADVDWETWDGHYRVRIPNNTEEAKPGDEMIWVDVPRRCRDHRAEHGRAHHGVADADRRRGLDPLLPAGEHDLSPDPVIRALAEQRRAWRLTVGQVSARMGCAQNYLEKLECGHRTPSLKRLHKWAEALGYELFVRPKIDG